MAEEETRVGGRLVGRERERRYSSRRKVGKWTGCRRLSRVSVSYRHGKQVRSGAAGWRGCSSSLIVLPRGSEARVLSIFFFLFSVSFPPSSRRFTQCRQSCRDRRRSVRRWLKALGQRRSPLSSSSAYLLRGSTTCAGNWLRTVTSDQNQLYNNSSLSLSFELVIIERNKFIICFICLFCFT